MNNRTRITYSLCSALIPFLCASLNGEEAATHGMDVNDKILLMETINVTSNKEIADEDEHSGDPEVDQVLNLVDSLTMLSDQAANESTSVESDDVSDSFIEETSVESTTTDQKKDKVHTSDSDRSKTQKTEPKAVSEPKSKDTE